MGLIIRGAVPGDFPAALALFGQLWPNKELRG
jgi:hypothetical protein